MTTSLIPHGERIQDGRLYRLCFSILMPDFLTCFFLEKLPGQIVEGIVFAWGAFLNFKLSLYHFFDFFPLMCDCNDFISHAFGNDNSTVVISDNSIAGPNKHSSTLNGVIDLPRPEVGGTLFGGRGSRVDRKAILFQHAL